MRHVLYFFCLEGGSFASKFEENGTSRKRKFVSELVDQVFFIGFGHQIGLIDEEDKFRRIQLSLS